MNEKEFNLQILAKLVEIANAIFKNAQVSKEGTYTAAELWNGKNALGENITLFIDEADKHTYTAEVGTFKFTVSYEDVFYRLWQFEKLCRVRDEKKARFTFGAVESEIISKKAMYKSNSGKIITRKRTMVKVEENVAYSVEKSNVNIFVLYFLANGIWYAVGEAANKESVKSRAKLLMQKDFILNNLTRRPELMDETMTAVAPIFKALYKVLTAEACNDAKEERKPENKAKNTLKTRERRIVITHQIKSDSYKAEIRELQYVGNRLYKDAENLYYLHNEYCYILGGYTRGVAAFLKEQQDIQTKIISMIDEGSITTESAQILYEKITGHVLGEPAKSEPVHEETHEDYPPEPYNEVTETLETVRQTVGKHEQKRATEGNMLLRQKVFPNELYLRKRKIRRFKLLYRVEYINYHSCRESAVNQTGIAKSGVHSVVMIRGSTKNIV